MGKLPSIRSQISILVVACILPLMLGVVLSLAIFYGNARTQFENEALQTARALISAVDRDLGIGENAALALATSPSITTKDFAAFHAQATSLLRDEYPGTNFVLSQSDGQQIVNTLRPFGDPLPLTGNPARLRRIFESGKPVISDVFVGGVLRRPVISVDVPVWRDGTVIYNLGSTILPTRLSKILTDQRLPADRVVVIFDTKGVIVSRSHSPEAYVGQKGASELIQRMQETPEGVLETTLLDGIQVIAAFSRSATTGWTVALAIPKAMALANMLHSISLVALIVTFGLAAGSFFAWMLGGRISRSVRELTAPVLTLGTAEALVFQRPYFREAAEIADVLKAVDAELNGHRHHLEALVAERTVALNASRERLVKITDSLFEGVVVVDGEGRISFANPSARRLLDFAGDMEGHCLDDCLRLAVAGGVAAFEASPFRKVLMSGIPARNDDAVFVTAAGTHLPVAYACVPVGSDEGRHAAVLSFRDIGAVKQAQREALQASRLASVGQLAAGIAHEINTPVQYVGDNLRFLGDALAKLTAAVAAGRDLAVQAALQPNLTEAAARFDAAFTGAKIPFLMAEIPTAIGESLDGTAQIARIVLSMKEFSHPGTTTKTMADLNRALDNTLTVSLTAWKQVAEVVRDFDPALPQVLCHAGELNQVFLNLIVNAAHAIEESGKPFPGRITISTRQDGDHAEIRVADSGTGVPPSIREWIFDPFFTTKEVGKGTGQGLAICRDVVVVKHGGRMDIADNDGGGAVFIVRLPIHGNGDAGEQQ